jgi:hypothetical protein
VRPVRVGLAGLSGLWLAACSAGETIVTPSPSGALAHARACASAPADIVPTAPATASAIAVAGVRGSAADAVEWLRHGFETAVFQPTGDQIAGAQALTPADPSRWGEQPLTGAPGTLAVSIVRRGDAACERFEALVAALGPGSDPGDWLTDARFGPASPRNWCVAAAAGGVPEAWRYARDLDSRREGDSTVTIETQTVHEPGGQLQARRTRVLLTRATFPIGVSSVSVDCSGDVALPMPPLAGSEGLALRPARPATLIQR